MTIIFCTFEALFATETKICDLYPSIKPVLPAKITYITSEELLERYPNKTPKQRETAFCQEHGAVFIIGIGGQMVDGSIHDGRAPDYDDWSTPREGGVGLNGDMLLWHPTLEIALEISSMGIRVNAESLERQLQIRDCLHRATLPFHRGVLWAPTRSWGGCAARSR